MIGLNGALLGKERTSQRGVASGVWTLNEQGLYQREGSWVGDASFASNSLLLHMNGTNGSTTFTDDSSNAFAATVSGAQISTAQSKFGGASGSFPGSTSHVSFAQASAFDFGTTDWTIEMWIYKTTTNASVLATKGYGLTSVAPWMIYVGGATDMYFYASSNGTTWDLSNGQQIVSGGVSANNWHHVAVTRQSGFFRMFLNGAYTNAVSGTNTALWANSSITTIGNASSLNNGFTGYIDEVRITKGIARYTAAFTVPTAPFSNS